MRYGPPKRDTANSLEVEDYPQGYPRLATFLNSDDSFSIYRGFGYLQSRLILEKQNELEILEEKVDRMDIRDAEQNNRSLHTRAFHQENIPRSLLLREAEKRFGEYSIVPIHSIYMLYSSKKKF